MAFHSVPFDSLSFNPFTKLGQEWALVTAGDASGFNTMTVSWGAFGYIWKFYPDKDYHEMYIAEITDVLVP